MTGALVLFSAGSVSQLSTAIFLSLIGLVGFTWFRPFLLGPHTIVASMAQFQIFVVVFLGLIGKLDKEKFEGTDGTFIGVLLVVLTVIVLLTIIVLLVVELWFDNHHLDNDFRSLDRLKEFARQPGQSSSDRFGSVHVSSCCDRRERPCCLLTTIVCCVCIAEGQQGRLR